MVRREFGLAQQLARGVVVRESDRREVVTPTVAVVEKVAPPAAARRIIERKTGRMTTALENLLRHSRPGEDTAETLERILHERTALASAILDAYEQGHVAPLERVLERQGDDVVVKVP